MNKIKQTLKFSLILFAALLLVSFSPSKDPSVKLFDGISSPDDDGKIILTPKPGTEPKINGPRLFGVRPGRPFIYRIPCTGKRPMIFEVDNLPEGLVPSC